MPEVLIFLIILGIWQGFEYASDIKYTKVLNMLWYGYNNIIKTNVILLEFLSARFVHSGVLQLTILSFFWHELEHNHNKIFNKLFFLTTMTSELLKYLNEHLGVSSGQIITPPFKIFPLPPHLHPPIHSCQALCLLLELCLFIFWMAFKAESKVSLEIWACFFWQFSKPFLFKV